MDLLDFDEKKDSTTPLYDKRILLALIGLSVLGFIFSLLGFFIVSLEMTFTTTALLTGYLIARQYAKRYRKWQGIIHILIPALVHAYLWLIFFGEVSIDDDELPLLIGISLGLIGLPILVQLVTIK